MIIDPQFRRCVTYLYADFRDEELGATKRKPIATAFYVSVPLGIDKINVVYIVTAKHVIEKSRQYEPLIVRFNTKDGNYLDSEIPYDRWNLNQITDFAVVSIPIPPEADLVHIQHSLFASSEFIKKKKISEGDDVFFCGLFSGFSGLSRVQPIIRFGNISLMPYEKIPVTDRDLKITTSMDAYLIESRSWGGHSGSPAFIYLKPDRNLGKLEFDNDIPFRLLGMVTHHYEIDTNVKFTGDILGSGKVEQNAGIAIVIPIKYLEEMLFSDEFVKERENILYSARKNS